MKHLSYYHFRFALFLLNHSEHDIFIHNFQWMFVISQFRKRCQWAEILNCPLANIFIDFNIVKKNKLFIKN